MPPADVQNRIYEDIGALKALVSSIDAKLNGLAHAVDDLRDEGIEHRVKTAELANAGAGRGETLSRLETKLAAVEQRVDRLASVHHRIGGAGAVLLAIAGVSFEVWQALVGFLAKMAKAP